MKKEMLSKVMKRAWEIKKQDVRNIFGICLKMAWAEIKEVAKAVKEKFTGVARLVVDESDFNGNENFFTFKRWQKAGKDRIYMTDRKGISRGYYDVANKQLRFDGYKYYNDVCNMFLNKYEIA